MLQIKNYQFSNLQHDKHLTQKSIEQIKQDSRKNKKSGHKIMKGLGYFCDFCCDLCDIIGLFLDLFSSF